MKTGNLIAALLLFAASHSHAAENSTGSTTEDTNEITRLLEMRLGNDNFAKPVKTPIEGIYQTQFGSNYAYLTHDGRFLFMGNLMDLEQGVNLTKLAKSKINVPATIPLESKNKWRAGKPQMTELLKSRFGIDNVSEPVNTPVDSIYQTEINSNIAYLTEDGRYVFMANLIDLERGLNLTEVAKRKVVKAEMNLFATEDKALFPAKGPEKAVINIFTDTSCSTCKKLFEEVPKLQEAGISIRYLPFPDQGLKGPGYRTLRRVWCSKDKAKALTIGKGLAAGALPAGNCDDGNLVDKGHALGLKVGVVGTPAIFKQNGEQIRGYVPYQKLIPRVLNN